MAVRSVVWRRLCPERIASTMEDAQKMTLYLVHQTGPTGFLLKDEKEKSKIKVFLGDPHSCSCPHFKKCKELCVHILWILLKKFRIPRTNPVTWQLGLVEREINEIVYEHLRRQSPSLPKMPPQTHQPLTTQKHRIQPKEISEDDVCPICQDDLIKGGKKLTYCRFNCGKSMHVKCMRIWSDHQKSMGEHTVKCPLCRQDFGTIITLTSSCDNGNSGPLLRSKEKPHQHLGTACSHCHVCPVVGKCYKCMKCPSYFLCHQCYSSNQVHLLHSFVMRQHCSQPWRSATRSLGTESHVNPRSHSIHGPSNSNNNQPEASNTLSPAVIQSLQTRSLTEDDYETLLGLDRQSHNLVSGALLHRNPRGQHEGTIWLPAELLEVSHPLILSITSCGMCQLLYQSGDWVTTLPCKHQFHQACVAEWINASHMCCPFDNLPIKPSGPSHHPRHQPHLEVATSLSRDLSHPVLQKAVRRGSNILHDRTTPGEGREGGDNKLKFGIAGTKLTISGQRPSSIPAQPTSCPSNGSSPSCAHQQTSIRNHKSNSTKVRRCLMEGTVERKTLGHAGLTGLSHHGRELARKAEPSRNPVQVNGIHIPTS